MVIVVVTRSNFFFEAIKFIVGGNHTVIKVSSEKDLEKAEKFEVVLIDLFYCPDGVVEIVESFKNINPSAKIFIFSFDPPSRFRGLIRELDVDGYINRPLDPSSILEILEII